MEKEDLEEPALKEEAIRQIWKNSLPNKVRFDKWACIFIEVREQG